MATKPDQVAEILADAMANTSDKINQLMEVFVSENQKFESGNSAAGTRARKALGELAKLAKARRAEITETKNARKAS